MKNILLIPLIFLGAAVYLSVFNSSGTESNAMPVTQVQQNKNVWEYTEVQGHPAVVFEDEKSAMGVIVGGIHASMKADWWLYYIEVTDKPFLLVAAAVDGKTIALCETEGDVGTCDYRLSSTGGASMLALTTEQVKAIQAGKEIELTFFFENEFVSTRRSLVGIGEPMKQLLAANSVPAEAVPPQEEVTVPTWSVYETRDNMLGHVVLVHGPLKGGEVVLSWSSTGYEEHLVDIKNYSGSEIFFKPEGGEVVSFEDVYWMHNGRRTDIEIADKCKADDKKLCVFRGGVSIVMSTTDLVWMQIGHEFVLEWKDAAGKHHKSSVILGSKSNEFNARIRELMKPEGSTTT